MLNDYLESSRFAIDGDGRFTSHLSYQVIAFLFNERNQLVSIDELVEKLDAPVKFFGIYVGNMNY